MVGPACAFASCAIIAESRRTEKAERTERGEATLDEAAAILKISQATVLRLIQDKVLQATQFCKGAPWVIRFADLESYDVKQAADARRLRRPPSEDRRQNNLPL